MSEESEESKPRSIKEKIWSFGGKQRVWLPEDVLENIAETTRKRLSEEDDEVVDVIRKGFKTLSDMQKRVLLLMVNQNMTERKAAKVLGISYSTLLNHLNRARKKLKLYVMQNTDSPNISDDTTYEVNSSEAETDAPNTNDINEDSGS